LSPLISPFCAAEGFFLGNKEVETWGRCHVEPTLRMRGTVPPLSLCLHGVEHNYTHGQIRDLFTLNSFLMIWHHIDSLIYLFIYLYICLRICT
jgi:hypothetical protein